MIGTSLESAQASNIKITAQKGSTTAIIYDGESKEVEGYTATYSTDKKAATINFFDAGTHTVVVSLKDDETKSASFTFDVGNTDAYVELDYSFDDAKIDAYEAKVKENAGKDLIAGESSFTVPELSSLIATNFPYDSIRKTVYYNVTGETSYKNTYVSKADLKFSISTYGTYRFYVLFSIEKSNNNLSGGKELSVMGLKEQLDGFYQYYDESGKKVYFNSADLKFYVLDDEGNSTKVEAQNVVEEAGKANSPKKIVPIFTFEVATKKPTIKIDASYQEDGYVGLKYTVTSVTVYGDVTYKKYELLYKANANDAWAVAEEDFDETNFTFTPQKKGIYAVRVTAYGANEENPVSKITPNILVEHEYEEVAYKTSFNDWFKVNTVPFILLCVSGLCLISIVLLLVINPKNKEEDYFEEDR